MSKNIIKYLKRCILSHQEEKISKIIDNKNKVKFLSKRDLNKLMIFMKINHKYSVSIIEYIYKKSEHRNSSDIYLIGNAFFGEVCRKGNIEVVKFLLSQCITIIIDPSANNNYSIINACHYGHLEVVKYLLSEEIMERFPNIDPSANYNEALKNASIMGNIEVVKYLLSAEIAKRFPKIDPSCGNNNIICSVSMNEFVGTIDILKILLQDERVINKGLTEAIRYARMFCREKNMDLLTLYLFDGKS